MSDADMIRSLIGENCLAANDCTADPTPETLQRWVNTFTRNGTFELEGYAITGHAALLAFNSEVMGRPKRANHFVGESCIELSDGNATGTAEFLLIGQDGSGVLGIGRYTDRYEKEDGRWRLAYRRASMLGGATPEIAALASGHGSPV